jgi:hypothetical protein
MFTVASSTELLREFRLGINNWKAEWVPKERISVPLDRFWYWKQSAENRFCGFHKAISIKRPLN